MSRKPNATNIVDSHIGQRVQLRRVMLGMTQTDLAKRCGISFQQIQKYETAGNRISASRLFDISQALETSVAFFYMGLPGNFPPETKRNRSIHVHEPSDSDPLTKNETLQMINLYWNLSSDEKRSMILKMLKTLNGENKE